MFNDLVQAIINGIGGLGDIFDMLPLSPFARINEITASNEILGFLSWLVPFDSIVALLDAWLVAIGFWYMGSKILRWMKAIE